MVFRNIRLKSAAGWYLGGIEVVNGESQPYDRESEYYQTEELLKSNYPNSLSLDEFWIAMWIED